jgi:hypothetical protein
VATLEDIHFPLPDDSWRFLPDQSNGYKHHWINSNGDRLSLTQLPPFDARLQHIFADPNSLAHYYQEGFNRARRGLVECRLCRIDHHKAVYIIGKQTHSGRINGVHKAQSHCHGLTYLGLITIPLESNSFIFSLACSEQGITGIREALVSERLLTCGLALGPKMWFDDPFDSGACEPYRRSLSDAVEYDVHFPDHPLARLRRYLRHLFQNVTLSVLASDTRTSTRILTQFKNL